MPLLAAHTPLLAPDLGAVLRLCSGRLSAGPRAAFQRGVALLDHMREYCEHDQRCRHAELLSYFGESLPNGCCGSHCDVCAPPEDGELWESEEEEEDGQGGQGRGEEGGSGARRRKPGRGRAGGRMAPATAAGRGQGGAAPANAGFMTAQQALAAQQQQQRTAAAPPRPAPAAPVNARPVSARAMQLASGGAAQHDSQVQARRVERAAAGIAACPQDSDEDVIELD